MVDLTKRVEEIKKLVDSGKYFTINRARQYGKTTTLTALYYALQKDYTVVSLSFEGISDSNFASEQAFVKAFCRKLLRETRTGLILPDQVKEQISDFFGVTVDYLLVKHDKVEFKSDIISSNKNENIHINKFVVSLLGATPAWLIATLIFVILSIVKNTYYWMIFYISIPITLLLFLIFNSIWGNKRINYLFISLFILSILFCFYIGFIKYNIWQIFILLIPAEIIIFLWSRLKSKKNR